jgi:DNA-binding MarR family transcriptional regulator
MLAIYYELAKEFSKAMMKRARIKHKCDFHDGIFGEKFVLRYLDEKSGALPGEISDAIGITTARVAATLNSLESKGLVTREIDKEDRRKIIVTITPKGKEVSSLQNKEHIDHFARVFERLGEADAREYVRLITRVTEINEDFFGGEKNV